MKVPEPRKLKSGNWFIQLRLNGVSIPVTASTPTECIHQAEMIKAAHRAGKQQISQTDTITLGQLIDYYIIKYEKVLSPATIRGYSIIRRNRFQTVMDVPFRNVKSWQAVINQEYRLVGENTVRKGWGLVTAALNDSGIPIPNVKLAKVPLKETSFLEPEEIKPFLEAARGDKAEVEMLLELHGLRESEAMYVVRHNMIDIEKGIIHVRGAIVPDKNHKFVEKKTNKTKSSSRDVPIMIPRLTELIREHQESGKPIKTHSASALLSHVHKTCKRAGVTDVSNHGLRRTMASLGYSVGISERALMALGGWEDPQTMHKIYIKLANRDKEKSKNAIAEFFSTMA